MSVGKWVVKKSLQSYWRITRPMTLGAQGVVLDDQQRVLLVRHTYRPGWHFPGGGVEKNETIQSALLRELYEETGVEPIEPPELFAIYANFTAFPSDHIALFVVRNWRRPVIPKPNAEIAEHGFFAHNAMPDSTHRSISRRLAEIIGNGRPDENWYAGMSDGVQPRPIEVRATRDSDSAAISALLADVFGPGRFARSAYRVRERLRIVSPYCRVAICDGQLMASVSFTPLSINNRTGALMLGPVAVARRQANQGHGRRLIAEGLAAARSAGERIVILVGDLDYYGRLGFATVPNGQIIFPGPVDPGRILATELVDGALQDYRGLIVAADAEPPSPQ